MSSSDLKFLVSPEEEKLRLDRFLKTRLLSFSRNQIQKWINCGSVLCNGRNVPSAHLLKSGETITLSIPQEEISVLPELIPLDILYEDRFILVVNKPAGMTTHPAVGNFRGTLANAVAYHLQKKGWKHQFSIPELAKDETVQYQNDEGIKPPLTPPFCKGGRKGVKNIQTISIHHIRNALEKDYGSRLGIVHRLDKETSGVLVLAKKSVLMENLSRQFQQRTVAKIYRAIVSGKIETKRGEIVGSIGKDFRLRKMVVSSSGRYARTDFKVLRSFPRHTYLEVYPKTGRTHQIRVHLSKIGYPILGDKTYGQIEKGIPRQMLHAYQITIQHPVTKKRVSFTAPLPKDFLSVLKKLESNTSF